LAECGHDASNKSCFIDDGGHAVTTLPHTFKRIRLNLARSKEFPTGSSRHGYEFVAPLDDKGHIDVELWRQHRDNCRVRRFWEGQDDESGFVVHKQGGPEHARWIFDYDPTAVDDDESGYRFGAHVFRSGEYVSIRNDDGEMHTYQVVSVEPAT
jgi:hypothetical protein